MDCTSTQVFRLRFSSPAFEGVEIVSVPDRTQAKNNRFTNEINSDGLTWQVFTKTTLQLMGDLVLHSHLAAQLGYDLKAECLFQNSGFGIAFPWRSIATEYSDAAMRLFPRVTGCVEYEGS